MSPKLLHLLRHAKSSWDHGGLSDHERPLNARGQRACALLTDRLQHDGFLVERVLCSSATRARQTLDGIADALPVEAEVQVLDALYHAGTSDLVDQLRATPDTTRSVLLIGHNPGIGSLAWALAEGADPASGPFLSLRDGYPTGALASFSVDDAWAELGPATTQLTGFIRPRELE